MTVAALAGRVEFEQGRGAFADAALLLREYGLCPIPVGGNGDKIPLVKGWTSWLRAPSQKTITRWIDQYPDANIGIACGLSGVTIIDIDDPSIVTDMIQRFGDTPLKTSTPSGGVHLWFKSSGERNANLRSYDLDVDVRGVGGMAIVPPSVRRSGNHAGNSYDFLAGGWMDLSQLPLLKAGVPLFDNSGRGTDQFTGSIDTENRVSKGMRNNAMFYFAKAQARYCDNLDDLLDVAKTYNMDFVPPLSNQEVERVARSVWGYYERGELWISGGPPRVVVKGGEDGELSILDAEDPVAFDAFVLLVKLKEKHEGRRTRFAVVPKAMAAKGFIPAWRKSDKRYKRALRWLVSNGWLNLVHCGGKRPSNPNLFSFCNSKGVTATPNITNTPSPPWGWGGTE